MINTVSPVSLPKESQHRINTITNDEHRDAGRRLVFSATNAEELQYWLQCTTQSLPSNDASKCKPDALYTPK